MLTGATSGIGLCTARMAARRGARLVLAARNEDALEHLASELNQNGQRAIFVQADVGKEGDVKKIEAEALNHYGNFDTWINNAGVSIYGKLEDVPVNDLRQLFETNFWGTVYGSLVAARNLKIYSGALINVGSTLSDRAIPLQGIYCASKHAVKGFTDALRIELEAESAPVSVTLVKPSAINTPYKEHARNYLDIEPENPPPVYAPETVAKAILYCAENPVRDVYVGSGAKALAASGYYAPRVTDRIMEATLMGQTRSGQPAKYHAMEALYDSKDSSLSERGSYGGYVFKSSPFTAASLRPVLAGLIASGAVAIGAGLLSKLYKKAAAQIR